MSWCEDCIDPFPREADADADYASGLHPRAYYELSERELCGELGYCPDCRELAHDGKCFKR